MSDHSSIRPSSLLEYCEAGSERLSAREEAEIIHSVYVQTIEEGESWSLIDYRWWNQWINYAGFDDKRNATREPTSNDRPGVIDNNSLAHSTDDGALKRDLVEGEDYVLVHHSVADRLFRWYGGGPIFNRSVITQGARKRTRVDLFPFFLTIIPCNSTGTPDEENGKVIPCRGKLTMGEFIKVLYSYYRSQEGREDGEEGKEGDETIRIWIEETEEEKQKKKEMAEKLKKDAMDTESTSSSSSSMDESPTSPSSPPPPAPLDDGWKLIRGDDLKQPIEQFNFSHRAKLLIDRKNMTTGDWQRFFKERHWREFQIGDRIDAMDRVKNWYGAVVRHIDNKNKRIQVKFNGWSTNFDEWIEMDSERLAPEGTKVVASSSSSSTRGVYSSSSYYSSWNASDEGHPSISGAVGLRNLGNTCFMNSIIQCLSHTPILNEFFVDDEYLSQINRDNPLGWQGKIAEEWGSLMKEIWSDQYTAVAPRKLKDAIAEFQPRFSGYQQHDSSELLSFLLDGLHEDLNRIKKKPFTNAVESNNRPDHIVAEEAWQVFQLRNKSIIVDNIYGQYKSRVVCPKHECGRISITFDPFHMISVPLPQQMDTIQKVHLVYADRSKPVTQYGCVVSKVGPMNELKESLSKLSGVNPKRMIVVELWQGKVYRFFDEDSSVGDIRPNDHIYIYEVPSAELYKPGEFIPIQIINVRAEKNKYYDPQWDSSKAYELSLMGIPSIIILPIKQSLTSKAIRALIRAQIDRTIRDTPLPPPRPDNNNNNNDDPAMNTDNNNNHSFPNNNNDNNNNTNDNNDSSSKPANNAEYDRRNPPRPDDIPDPSGFPFRILQLETDGRSCYQCPYTKNCIGCELPNSDDLYEIRVSQRYSYIDSGKEAKIIFAILWKGDGGLYDHDNNVKNIMNDASCLESSDNLTKLDEVSLFDCIKLFTKEETLSEQDPWYCSNCKEFRQATKKFDLWRLPNILIIHLKRFAYTKTYREKISTLVRYPIEGLDLSDFCVNDDIKGKKAIYDLYAVSNHMGGMGGGHYIAHIKNLMNGEWYCHDDSHVSSCSSRENDIVNSSAYVLFYVRRDVLTPWKGKPIIRRPSSLGGGGNNNSNNNDNNDNNNTEGDKKINGKEEKGMERREGEGESVDAVSIAGPVQNKGIDRKELIMEHRSIQHGLREADEREMIDRANTSLDDVE